MTDNAISCLYPTAHLTRVRMYSKCLIRTCSMLPQNDKCGPLNACAVWIWMDVSVLIRFWIISTDLNESLYSIHQLWDLLLVVSHIYLLHSLACSSNEALLSVCLRGCGVLAYVLGSSQLSFLFSLALPQVVLTHSIFTWLQQLSTCLWSLYYVSGADLGRKVCWEVTRCILEPPAVPDLNISVCFCFAWKRVRTTMACVCVYGFQSSWDYGKGTLWGLVVRYGLSAYVSQIIFVFISEQLLCRF